MIRILGYIFLCLMAFGPAAVSAQGYPSRPVTIVLPFPAGTGTDAILRILAEQLSTRLGGSVVVDNRPGANGSIAAGLVGRAQPDGYTLLMTTNTTHSANPSLMRHLPYDPIKDFTPITRLGNLPFLLAVAPSVSASNLRELAEYVRSNPGKVTYASGNSTGIIAGATLNKAIGGGMIHVPYRGSPPALNDILGGRITMMFVDFAAGLPHVRTGAMRGLAVTTGARSDLFPELPTMHEFGLANFEIVPWIGMFGPKDLPADITAKLNAALRDILVDPAIRKRFGEMGFDAFGSTPGEFEAFVRAELARWAALVKDAGVEPQ